MKEALTEEDPEGPSTSAPQIRPPVRRAREKKKKKQRRNLTVKTTRERRVFPPLGRSFSNELSNELSITARTFVSRPHIVLGLVTRHRRGK